ncbi:hypothetical protein BX666DRAFT_1923775 [Dichotomocladium elegans]|nr:hypothetical protein BX666DRAFT_1923775 [Dichotomocladium elegans]
MCSLLFPFPMERVCVGVFRVPQPSTPAFPHKTRNIRFFFEHRISFSTPTMIAPITGKFRKQFLRDLTISLTLGGAAGAWWWNIYHLGNVKRRDAYYAKLEASKNQ